MGESQRKNCRGDRRACVRTDLLIIRFWDMLFFALVVFIGYIFGKRKDLKQGSMFHFQEWGRWLSERWRPFK